MAHTFSASGTVDEAKKSLTLQAEQYVEAQVHRVKDFLHALLDEVEEGVIVSVSASGEHDGSGYRGTYHISPLNPSPTAAGATPAG